MLPTVELKLSSHEFETDWFQSLTCLFLSVKIKQSIVLLNNVHKIVSIQN